MKKQVYAKDLNDIDAFLMKMNNVVDNIIRQSPNLLDKQLEFITSSYGQVHRS